MDENCSTGKSTEACDENESVKSTVRHGDAMDTSTTPEVGMQFETHEAARVFYDQYARHKGFSTKIKRSWKRGRSDELSAILYSCSKAGSKHENKNTQFERGSSLTDCKAEMRVKRTDATRWKVTEVILDHNHELVPSSLDLYRPNRCISSGVRRKLKKRLLGQPLSTQSHLNNISGEMNKLLSTQPITYLREAEGTVCTPADIKELPASYVYIIDMPGLKSDDIKVQVEDNNILSVCGERKNEREDPEAKFIRMERVGKFMRRFTLPANANVDSISAICRDAVVTITVAKIPPESKRPNVVEIKLQETDRNIRHFASYFNATCSCKAVALVNKRLKLP